ncbi:hypothetical protein GCM10017083_04990 [Thalassobaculum fulvum]|uniref:Carbamoyltransferase n=1 Tax=Thalassobaculum fulvum TaxID=1633335 RepID=A0A919CMZ6_9PROT|nr:carbamoyltransferase C-terminal domain-containing protein [Thalassobaculum fulvum]GHD41069.1 hypothetical protein GCM10017083_04990 [Thalassobaculum fulvum]
MLILGLTVAHDAGVALVDDGRVVGLVQRERWDRRKRSALVTPDFLEVALGRLGVGWNQVDVVAISACQAWPFLFTDPARFRFKVTGSFADGLKVPAETAGIAARSMPALERHREATRLRVQEIARGMYGEYLSDDPSGLAFDRNAEICVEWPYYSTFWTRKIFGGAAPAQAIADSVRNSRPGLGYMGATATFDGVEKPAVIVPHHLAHAAYAFYQSGEDRAAVATLDNGDVASPTGGYPGGILAEGQGLRLRVLDFRFAFEGHFYQRMAEHIGLGHGGGAGKLMGLAPYGEPAYFDDGLVGNALEVFGEHYCRGGKDHRNHVIARVLAAAESAAAADDRLAGLVDGIDPSGFGAGDVTVQKTRLAATAQKLMEESSLAALRSMHAGYAQAGTPPAAVVLGGGVALNCPANTRMALEGPFGRVRVPPAVDDSGLPLGAAQAVAHDLFGLPRPAVDPDSADAAYLGGEYAAAAVDRAIRDAGDAVRVVPTDDPARDAAAALAADQVVAWFEGRSEVGPRALGHRSILADPRRAENWRRVNRLKKREEWRPFAPAVLKEKAAAWFDGPLPSAHMLFTARVKGRELPAITHVDGSARVQTVGTDCGGFRKVLEAFDAATGVPVVMNTSFNGPGEPIVETPEEAVGFLLSSEIDAVYVEGRKLVRSE